MCVLCSSVVLIISHAQSFVVVIGLSNVNNTLTGCIIVVMMKSVIV